MKVFSKPIFNQIFAQIGILSMTATAGLSVHAHARGDMGGDNSGGGDRCQDRIEWIRNNVSDWIQDGGARDLKFSGTAVSQADYEKGMDQVIHLTRQNPQTAISCTDDRGAVKIEDAEKTCRAYYVTPESPRILCYRGTLDSNNRYTTGFLALSEEEQFFLVHHELAVLAGLEDQSGALGNYPFSDQISARLEKVEVKMLRVLKPVNPDGFQVIPLQPTRPIRLSDASRIMRQCRIKMYIAVFEQIFETKWNGGCQKGRCQGADYDWMDVVHLSETDKRVFGSQDEFFLDAESAYNDVTVTARWGNTIGSPQIRFQGNTFARPRMNWKEIRPLPEYDRFGRQLNKVGDPLLKNLEILVPNNFQARVPLSADGLSPFYVPVDQYLDCLKSSF